MDLCQAADLFFKPYQATLAKCVFLAAWGGFMRTCEFPAPRKGRPDHNVLPESVNVTPDGLGISFWSDKTNTNSGTPKHRLVLWGFLPPGAKQIFQRFKTMRPKAADRFFAKEDGQPLTANEFSCILDACLLQTSHAKLKITGHGMRIGGASQG